jgi:hypothetical protein
MLLLAVTGFFGTAQAQEGIKVGFRATPLIGWSTTVDDSTKTKPQGLETKAGIGFAFDFVLTYGFSENFMIKTGVTIATKSTGSDFNFSSDFAGVQTSVVSESKVNFTAVEIPVGFKFRSPEIGDGMYIIGHFGLNPELNVQNKVTTDATTSVTVAGATTTTTTSTEQVDVDGIRLFTASFAPGVGLDWEFDWGMLEFAATYHWGLLPYTDPDKNGGLKSRLNAFALSVGYFF